MTWYGPKPLSKLAAEFGVSDQGLAKACRRHDVPVPPVGYWQKLAHGKNVEQPPLESGQFGDQTFVEVAAGVKMPPKAIPMSRVEQSDQKPLQPPQTSIEKPLPAHPMLAEIQKAFNKAKNPDEFALINVGPFKIRAAPMHSERIIAIISAILAATTSENWEIRTTKDGRWEMLASDARIDLAINENTRKVPHIPTPAEICDHQRYSWNTIPEFDLISASTGHKDALDEFVAAYEEWYKFHLEIYKQGRSGQLSPGENQELIDLIARRDQARENLVAMTS